MTKEELKKIGIIQWEEIKSKYPKIDLLLGNGFSIKLSSTFSYHSLFDNFINKCNPTHKILFQQFDTTNFELIMEYLTYADKVNKIFKINSKDIEIAIDVLRNGLIDSINDVHPKKNFIDWNYIGRITESLQGFNDIYTTNYDLYLYHIIMNSIDKNRIDKKHKPYQDYFWGDYSNDFKMFKHYQLYTNYKHVYYLHGSLFLFNNGIMDLKIKLNHTNNELLDMIANKIKSNEFPIFVSEGLSQDKVNTINRNFYLNFCLEKFKLTNKPILIYGHSLSNVDAHILKAIIAKPKDIFIAIFPDGKNEIQIQHKKYNYLANFPKYPNKITFIDSTSLFN